MPRKAPDLCSLGLFTTAGSGDVLVYIFSLALPADPRYLPSLLRRFAPLVHSTFAGPSIPDLGISGCGMDEPLRFNNPVSCLSVFPTVNKPRHETLPVLPPNPTLYTPLPLGFTCLLWCQAQPSPRRSHWLQSLHQNHLAKGHQYNVCKHRFYAVTPLLSGIRSLYPNSKGLT